MDDSRRRSLDAAPLGAGWIAVRGDRHDVGRRIGDGRQGLLAHRRVARYSGLCRRYGRGGAVLAVTFRWLGTCRSADSCCRLRNEIYCGGRSAERCGCGGRAQYRNGEESLMHISHLSAVLLFSLCVSVVFGITQRTTSREMIRYGLFCFALFVVGAILAGWLMFFIRH